MPPPSPRTNPHIVVLGAGITGLTTSLHLLHAGYSVTLIAEYSPGDKAESYTSPWAGAVWRTHAEQGEEMAGWDVETYKAWMGGVGNKEREDGFGVYELEQFWANPTPSDTSPWYAPFVSNYAVLPASSLPANTTYGSCFTTITIDVDKHLSYLLSHITSLGGLVLKAHLPTTYGFPAAIAFASELVEKEGRGKADAWVNATGIGAKELVGDEKCGVVRGQIVVVKGEAKKARTRLRGDGGIDYVIPRQGSGETVLGGTKEVGNWSTSIDQKTTERILEGCKDLAPELLGEDGQFHVLRLQVGLRPSREGGPRVEPELVDGKYKVVHAYGHSGAGYQNSIGSARKVLRLVERLGLLSPKAKL